jgi:hypothetical protein
MKQLSVDHHGGNLSGIADLQERITVEQNQVGDLACFDRAQ